jgi:hypothetical protein
MAPAAGCDPRIPGMRVTRHQILANRVDGRAISVSLAGSWRLSESRQARRLNFRIIGNVQGIHWPDVDEDISIEGMPHGPLRHARSLTRSRWRGMQVATPERRTSTCSRRLAGLAAADV